jgi:hypothetical protein
MVANLTPVHHAWAVKASDSYRERFLVQAVSNPVLRLKEDLLTRIAQIGACR